MKLLLYLLFTFSILSYSKGQNFVSLLDTTLEWTGCLNYQKDTTKTNSPVTFRFINKDTVFKNDTFKVLMAYTDIDTFVMGGLREDTLNKKTYGFYSNDTTQYLMYDWTLKKGDTIKYPNITYVVDDSVGITVNGLNTYKYIFRGVGLKNTTTFGLTSPPLINYFVGQEHFWIPEMGSSVGLLNPCVNVFGNFQYKYPYIYFWQISVKKVLQNTDTLFFNEFCGQIFLPISVPELSRHEDPLLSIDYSSKTLRISSQKDINDVIVYDCLGKEIKGFLTENPKPLNPGKQRVFSFSSTENHSILILNIKFFDNTSVNKKIFNLQ